MYLTIYSRRREHNDRISISKNDNGWYIGVISQFLSGDCNQRGEPKLFEVLNHDFINYPADLGGYMEWLWNQADQNNMSEEQIQTQLDILGDWITAVEQATPAGIFSDYN